MLEKLLTQDRINIVDSVNNWEDAIRLASKPLLNENTIEKRYVDAMINAVKEFGAYIVLTDYFAMPHSRPENGVNETSMALLIVKEPVDLLEEPVNIFLVLAAKDNSSHLEALSSMTEIVGNEENIEKLKNSQTTEEIIKIMKG